MHNNYMLFNHFEAYLRISMSLVLKIVVKIIILKCQKNWLILP